MITARQRFIGIVLPLCVIACAVGVGAFTIYQARMQVVLREKEEAEQRSRFDNNARALREALLGAGGVTVGDIQRGFWYSYKDAAGNDSVAYFDLDSAARADLSAEQVGAIASLVGGSEVLRGTVKEVDERQLPPALQYHNELYRSAISGTSTVEIEKTLEAKVRTSPTADALFRLSYLKELEGDYAARDALDKENCALFKERCPSGIQITLKGKIVDGSGEPVEGATVEVVSRPGSAGATTAPDGSFSLELAAKEMEKMRIRAGKRNFSDGYADTIILPGGGKKRTVLVEDIRLESPITIVTIDFGRRSVTGSGNSFNSDGSVTIRTSQSVYRIPAGAIRRESGAPYAAETVDVYLYEFTKGNPPESLMQLDTFDAVRGYAGDLMKSFGMPYIQFFAPGGEELHVFSSNPMQLTYTIANMDDLRANTDRIYRALTDEDMNILVEASKGRPYAIDREFLISHQMLQFPAFWVLDRRRGVWDNVGVTVLNPQGTIQTVFYTIRDGV